MLHQLNILLLCLGLFQGVLLGLFLFRRKKKGPSFIYLALLLTVASLQMTFKIVDKLWLQEHTQIAYLLSYRLPLLMGPVLFLFIKSNVKKTSQRQDLLHFVPFMLINLLEFFPYSISQFFLLSMEIETVLKLVSVLVYAVLSWGLIEADPEPLKRFTFFLFGVAVTELAAIAGLAFLFLYYPAYTELRFLFVPLTLLVYWMSYKVMTEPDYFFEWMPPVAVPPMHASSKYNHSGLKDKEVERIFFNLRTVLSAKKPYLDSSLTLEALANLVGTSKHNLSQVINSRLGKTFVELINDYRLEEVQQRLMNPKMGHFTIAAIAFDCGFNSISGFNEIFKKRVGLTPSKYRGERKHRITA